MKKIAILFSVLVCSIALNAQVKLGVKGGLNLANQKLNVDFLGFSVGQSGKAILGYQIGGMADIPVVGGLHFRPELLLNGKGANFKTEDEDDPSSTTTSKIRLGYLELPLNLIYKHPVSDRVAIYGGAGPSLAYGIFGKMKGEGAEEDAFQEGGFKRFDFGINMLAGVEVNNSLVINFNFTPGISNILDGDVDSEEGSVDWKNKYFGLTVGYFFKR